MGSVWPIASLLNIWIRRNILSHILGNWSDLFLNLLLYKSVRQIWHHDSRIPINIYDPISSDYPMRSLTRAYHTLSCIIKPTPDNLPIPYLGDDIIIQCDDVMIFQLGVSCVVARKSRGMLHLRVCAHHHGSWRHVGDPTHRYMVCTLLQPATYHQRLRGTQNKYINTEAGPIWAESCDDINVHCQGKNLFGFKFQ